MLVDIPLLICYNNSMRKYTLLIKSHTDTSDIERQVEANSKQEALDIFVKWLKPYGWDKWTIEKNIIAEDEFVS